MRKYGVVTNPRNFMIWYDYCSGINPSLTRTLEVLSSNKKELSPEDCNDLYEQFYTMDEEGNLVRETSTRLQENLNQVLSLVANASDDVSRYGDALENFSGQVSAGVGGEALRNLIENMLKDTKLIEDQNKQLQDQLSDSAHRVTQLTSDLEMVRQEAMSDALTGLANRKCFDISLRDAVTSAMENGTDLCLVLGDIDHFKRFNDTWGHQLGDQVLKLVSATMTNNLKGQDLAARYGGEEFAIVLPNTSLQDAAVVADNIRQKISANNLKRKKTGEDYGRITMSFGVARYEPGEAIENLIERADQALYAAKNQGRNRVISEDRGLVASFMEDSSTPRTATAPLQ